MTYIPFRKYICRILKKLLFIFEENDVTYFPAVSSSEGKFCKISITGKETKLPKRNKRVVLLAD